MDQRRGRLAALRSGPIPVVVAARTSTEDQQDPTLSIPRQVRKCESGLPEGFVIVGYFYDVESGRMDLHARGRGRAHERFAIPVPRDGGIQDLLDEAQRPDRRFDAVICESIDRISRRTYYGTLIEHTLEQAGVTLLAADEPITVAGKRTATQVLTRRVKQGVAEWYVLDMLEKSWGGFEEHTDQGFNIGKPPYGFLAEKFTVSLPRHAPAGGGGHRRNQPRVKHRLVLDPLRAPAVQQMYVWRVEERLGYKVIAERLNADLDRYPPPAPPDPARAVGYWTQTSVRDVLRNPKNTGYMVWNRRSTRARRGKVNPVTDWVWSTKPTHPSIVSVETYLAAFGTHQHRERSRTKPGLNAAHRQTKRSYPLRTYLFCDTDGCGRRMFGKTRNSRRGDPVAYYACAPAGHIPDGHPASLWVKEDDLLDGVHRFFATHVFGPHRHQLLARTLTLISDDTEQARQERLAGLRHTLADLDTRRARLIRSLELTDDHDGDLTRDVKHRLTQLRTETITKRDELAELENQPPANPAPELLAALPIGPHRLAELPEPALRHLFEAFRLEIRYDRHANQATCRVTLTTDTLNTLLNTINTTTNTEPPPPNGGDGPDTHEDFPSAACPRQCLGSGHPGVVSHDTPD